jgi:serine/threonine protein kinase
MAPEQFRDAKHIDNRADVWALGVILYQCLTGRLPFAGRRFDELERSIHSAVIPRPRSFRPDIPPSLEEACMKALARAPGDRFATASALADALERAPAKEKPARSRLVPAIAGVGVATIVLAALGVALLSPGSAGPSVPPPAPLAVEAPKPAPPTKPAAPEVRRPVAPLKLRNTWERLPPRNGQDWWNWSVYLDGDISNVDHVVYVLHPTFRDPVQTVRTPENRFAFATSGWGTFVVKAQVSMKDGSTLDLDHRLEFGDERGTSE